jgi:hypothetical protein
MRFAIGTFVLKILFSFERRAVQRGSAWLLCAALLLQGCAGAGTASPTTVRPTAAPPVAPGPCRVKTDMELAELYSLRTRYHSRTRLPEYRHVPGGITPATVRLQGGRGSVQLSDAWIDYVDRLNGRDPRLLSYLFHRASGWQNASDYGRVEELAFEDEWLYVTKVHGTRAYVQAYSVDDKPPAQVVSRDLRHQEFTVVTRDDAIIGAPPGKATIILIARAGEALWMPTAYLDCRAPMGSRERQ